jgi:hypothetical protein
LFLRSIERQFDHFKMEIFATAARRMLFFNAGGMKENSPRFQPWETEPEQSSPAGRKNISAAPTGLESQTMPIPTVKTVG